MRKSCGHQHGCPRKVVTLPHWMVKIISLGLKQTCFLPQWQRNLPALKPQRNRDLFSMLNQPMALRLLLPQSREAPSFSLPRRKMQVPQQQSKIYNHFTTYKHSCWVSFLHTVCCWLLVWKDFLSRGKCFLYIYEPWWWRTERLKEWGVLLFGIHDRMKKDTSLVVEAIKIKEVDVA